MNDVRRIGKNTLFLWTSQIIFSVLTLALSIFIGRVLGDVAYGKYSIASAFPQLLTVFIDFGYTTLLIKEVSKDKSLTNKYLSNSLKFRLLLFPIVFIVLVIGVNLMGYPDSTKNIVYLFGIFTFLRTITNIFYGTYRAYEQMEYEAAIVTITTILRTFIGILIILLGYGLFELGLIFVFFGVVEFVSAFIICRKKYVTKIEMSPSFIRDTIHIAFPLGMLSIFGVIYTRIDTIMLSIFKGDAVVGWYNAAYNLVLGFAFIPQLFMQALLPLMSIYSVSSKELLRKTYEKSFHYLFILGLPTAVGISFIADKIIFLFYGSEFIPSVIALQILGWDILLYFLYTSSGFLLVATNKQRIMASALALCAVFNFVINLFLIPLYSYIGAGIATLATEVILLLIYLEINRRNSYPIKINRYLISPIISSGVMGLFLFTFHELSLFIQIIFGMLIYFGFLILTKGLTKDDFYLFKQVIKRH